MSITFADGFDHWNNFGDASAGGNYFGWGYSPNIFIAGGQGRTGPNALYAGSSSNGHGGVFKLLPGEPRSTVGFHVACKVTDNPAGPSGGFAFQNGNSSNRAQLWCQFESGGGLGFYYGYDDPGNQRIGGVPAGTFSIGNYNSFETRVYCHSIQGTIELHVNGQQVCLIENVNTNGQGGGVINGIVMANRLRFVSFSNECYWDDFVSWNTDGPYNADFLGDVRCRTLRPNSDGALQDWTPHVPGPEYTEVNGAADPANHFISTPEVGATSTFGLDALPLNTAYCAGLFGFVQASKTDAGACNITPLVNNNGVEALGATINPGTNAGYSTVLFEADPTGTSWTRNSVNLSQFGVRRTV